MLKSKVGNGNFLLSKGWLPNPFSLGRKKKRLRQLLALQWILLFDYGNKVKKKKKRLKQSALHPVYSFATSFSHYWTLFWIMRRDAKVQGIQVKMWSNWDISSRNAKQCTSVEDGLTVSSKAKERPTIQPSIHASGYLPSWPEKLCSHKNLHMNFCSVNLTAFQIWPYDKTSLNGIQKKDI